ncbi:helix-turn-helix domain-containing protein [Gilvimarinus sp. SDUM040013]|uniref:Helix-turn-helix domain-containing protein n=2 Tax=Gilvimarinus gilvus TaxID=3058038 RepID=A0ABU4RUY1_9GAMM|nr:helix-turn-helix domain-containing protein [Gilvimarinus sp. SDUM040013]MDO3387943.1 helix-turn-helix domain-containing protein [Gilvimarinus sp. SDUM040013]MDX6848686.1 helix-turn-helix domain-containing protein [Gilvimarinus sp. SDUM040013]
MSAETSLCPTETALDLIGGKWKGMILFYLCKEKKRFNQLMRLVPGISQRMLTKQLRDLESNGIIHRKVYPEVPPKVEYSLTPLGKSLKPVVDALEAWGIQYIGEGGAQD